MAKFKRKSYCGGGTVFTAPPVKVTGGFNLDPSIKMNEGDVIPEGTLASFNEVDNRVVKIQKTAIIKAINANDAKVLTLKTSKFFRPIFVVGEKVLKEVAGTLADAPAIVRISNKLDGEYVITLDKEIPGLTVNDIIVHVVADALTPENAALAVPKPYSLTIEDAEANDEESETGVDVTIDSGNGAFYRRRIPPIPADMLGEGGIYLKYNPNIKLTNSK